MCQNGVAHDSRAKEVLLCYVIDRKFHPDNNGGSLRCGDDTLRRRRRKISLTATLSQHNKLTVPATRYNKDKIIFPVELFLFSVVNHSNKNQTLDKMWAPS